MTREARLQVVRDYVAAVNRGDVDGAHALLSPTYVQYTKGLPPGPLAAKQALATFIGGFSDLVIKIEWMLVDGDRVVARVIASGNHTGTFLGHAPTHREFNATGLDVFRIDQGLILERWSEFDTFGMMQQLGLIGKPDKRKLE